MISSDRLAGLGLVRQIPRHHWTDEINWTAFIFVPQSEVRGPL